MNVPFETMQLGQVITAIGGLGTASFGLVDAAKTVPLFGGINRIGLKHIKNRVTELTPDQNAAGLPHKPINALPRRHILETVEANWVNGTEIASQKAIAKSLIRLHLSEGNAAVLATRTNVDPAVLESIAKKTIEGTPLLPAECDVFSRFDLIVTALLDEAYQLSDRFTAIGRGRWRPRWLWGWPCSGDGLWWARRISFGIVNWWTPSLSVFSPPRWRPLPRTFPALWQRLSIPCNW